MSSATTVPSTTHTESNSQLPPQSNYNSFVDKTTTSRRPSSSPHIDITKEEFDRISEALKKEEFRKLFIDYVEEIQDPENRKRYEEEITQIEAERGVDVVFIHPEPGFVIKTSQDGNLKCFINCAKNEHVAKPSNEIELNQSTGQRGISWSIPMAQAPPRDDVDKNNKLCCVYDVVFHPDALYLAEKNSAFRKCLVDTALDAVEREYKVKLDRVNIKFPKIQFKGIARPTVIRKLAKNPIPESEEPHPLESIYPPKPTSDAGKPTVLPPKNMAANSTTAAKKNSEYCTPKYTIKHRRDVDLTEFTNQLDAKLNVTFPREIDCIIELPLLNSSSECQLDVTEKTLFLLSDRPGAKYRLNIELPFKVNDKDGSAKFDVDTRRLTINLPVVRQSLAKEREMHESLLHLNREDSGVESDMREDCHSNNSSSPVEELSSTSIDDTIQEAAESQEALSEQLPQSFLKHDVDYRFPSKVNSNVLDNTLSVVLHVRNVQEDSIKMQRDERSLHVQFISIGSGFYPTHYAFYLQLSKDKPDVSLQTVDIEAWENNVILNLNLNQSAEQLCSYLAGLDSSDLKEHWIHENHKIHHKSRLRQIPPDNSSSSLDVTVQQCESDKHVEIEIKSREAEKTPACYATTTEDEEHQDEDGDCSDLSHQNYKKQNKKQKRKNKKRRSLSESACDEYKAYHQQQSSSMTAPSTVPEAVQHDEDADDDDDEDSSPDRIEKTVKSQSHISSSFVNVPAGGSKNNSGQQRKHRSFSESRDSVISLSAGSASFKGILKHYSRYGGGPLRPSISDSCSSIDELSSVYSTSVDGGFMAGSTFNSLPLSHSFNDIPEENVDGLSESCKKTVRFSEVIKKQVFRMDSSILGQRKKNQKRRDRKQRALQRRLSEGDSADYEDTKPVTILRSTPACTDFLKDTNAQSTANSKNKSKGNDRKSNSSKARGRLESESSSDIDINKNAMMFEMDM